MNKATASILNAIRRILDCPLFTLDEGNLSPSLILQLLNGPNACYGGTSRCTCSSARPKPRRSSESLSSNELPAAKSLSACEIDRG